MSAHWATQSERGSVFGLKAITWVAFTFGRRFCRVLLYPVCLYFVLFAHVGVRFVLRSWSRWPNAGVRGSCRRG